MLADFYRLLGLSLTQLPFSLFTLHFPHYQPPDAPPPPENPPPPLKLLDELNDDELLNDEPLRYDDPDETGARPSNQNDRPNDWMNTFLPDFSAFAFSAST